MVVNAPDGPAQARGARWGGLLPSDSTATPDRLPGIRRLPAWPNPPRRVHFAIPRLFRSFPPVPSMRAALPWITDRPPRPGALAGFVEDAGMGAGRARW